jgi:hypothetical protein
MTTAVRLIAWLLIALASSSAENSVTTLREAQSAVDANLSTPEGKAYDRQLSREFADKYLPTMRQCKQNSDGDLRSFWILMKLAQDGAVNEVLLYPSTKLAECARETLLKGKLTTPPKPAYWVGVYMNLSH